MPKPIFTPEKLTATKFSTAEDKAKFLNDLAAFVESGYKRSKFSASLYRRLMNCFGHIAHYNIEQFYDVWFYSETTQAAWVLHVLEADCFGSPAWTYSDAEKQFQAWLSRK